MEIKLYIVFITLFTVTSLFLFFECLLFFCCLHQENILRNQLNEAVINGLKAKDAVKFYDLELMRPEKLLMTEHVLSSARNAHFDYQRRGELQKEKEEEIMYFKASAAVRIVSAIIKPRAMHQNCIQSSTIECVVDRKRFVRGHRPGQSLLY
jgi:hypothetical protein